MIKRNLQYFDKETIGKWLVIEIRNTNNDGLIEAIYLKNTKYNNDSVIEQIREKYIKPDSQYYLSFKYTNRFESRVYVNDIATNFKEFELKLDDEKSYKELVAFISSNQTNNKPVSIQILGQSSYINNFYSVDETKSVFVLIEDRLTNTTIGTDVEIFVVESQTDKMLWSFKFENIVRPRRVLVGSRRDYEGFTDRKLNVGGGQMTKYGTVKSQLNAIQQKDIFKYFDRNINFDFNSFENFVHYASAYSMVVNAKSKIERLVELGDYIDISSWRDDNISFSFFTDDWYSEFDSQIASATLNKNEVDEIIHIFKHMTPYERWIFTDKYISMTDEEFEDYIESTKIEASFYDESNLNMILYLVPDQMVINDTRGLMSTLLLIMGEFFDTIYFTIKSIENTKNYDLSSINYIDLKTITEALNKFGIKDVANFDSFTISEKLNNEGLIEEFKKHISIRLLDNLPYLIKSKGTRQVTQAYLNIFGVSSFVEESNPSYVENASKNTVFKTTQQRQYLINSSSVIQNVNITDSDLDMNRFTVEMMVNDLKNNQGSLIKFGTGYELRYEVDDNSNKFLLTYDNTLVYSSSVLSSRLDNPWTYIAFAKTGSSGTFYHSQQKVNLNELNTFTSSFTVSGTNPTFSTIDLLSGSVANITQFRAYTKPLSFKEMNEHARSFGSVAESGNKTLLANFYFYQTGSNVVDTQNGFVCSISNPSTSSFRNTLLSSVLENRNMAVTSLSNDDGTISIVGRNDTTKFTNIRTNVKYTKKIPDYMVQISPTKLFDEYIVKELGSFVNLVPNDYEELNTTFVDFENKKSIVDTVNKKVLNLEIYKNIFRIIDNNVFEKIRQNIPVNTNTAMGLIVRNHLLKRNKDRNKKYGLTIKNGYTTPVDDYTTTTVATIQNNRTVIDSAYDSVQPTSTSNYFSKHIITKQKKTNTVYLNDMVGSIPTRIEVSPWSKNLFRGFNTIQGLGNTVDVIDNAGAIIKVT